MNYDHEILGVGRVIHDLKDNYRQIRPEEHELLGVGRVIHGLKDNYRQIRP
jgi:predicted hydrolase (HD superfamily)